jgi:hypothetical protein
VTHTNHRQGTKESLSRDYVVLIMASRGINDKECGPKVQEFMRLGYKYGPVNAGPARTGDRFMSDPEKLVDRLARASIGHLVFDDREKVKGFIKELVEADLGLSVVVSGLFDEVGDMCQAAGIKRHTAQCSLGVWGNVETLPDEKILDITTMCGHSMVSFNLVQRMAREVQKGLLSLDEAGRKMARPCSCGVFNPKRAEELLKRCIEAGVGE